LKISSDTGFLLLQEMDEGFDIIGPMSGWLKDPRSPVHTRHSLVQMIRQHVYQISAGYEDCNDADHLRIDPSLQGPTHSNQENATYFGANCFHPLFGFTSDSACLWAKPRSGNVHSANGTLGFIYPIMKRCRSWFW
jgi:hypothetical protein